jgi:hypothetical protein
MMKTTARSIAGTPELKIRGANEIRTPVAIWTSFRVTSGDQCKAFLMSSAAATNVPRPNRIETK